MFTDPVVTHDSEVGKYMLDYLQSMLDDIFYERRLFGDDDRIVKKKLCGALACKEMVELMLGVPVNLQKDGRVTVGF